jgi:hypothetical protein
MMKNKIKIALKRIRTSYKNNWEDNLKFWIERKNIKKISLKGQPKIKISIVKGYAMLPPLISLKNMNGLYFEYIEEMNDSLLCLL